nr:hypothetical protein HmN_000738300 [Hymenolepis microstoma]
MTTPQPKKVRKLDHQGREYVPPSATSTFNEKMNADRSDSNDKMRVVTGESTIPTESKFNTKGIKQSVLMVDDFHQVDLNELDPNVSTAKLVKCGELPKVSTQIVANQKVCSEVEISSGIVINQQNDLLKSTSKSGEPVISVPPKINVPGKGSQSNFSVKNNLTQPKLPCGEVSMTVLITNDSLCTDRNKVKFEASEVKRDEIEDLQKDSFVTDSNHKVSSKVDILSENVEYQELETSKSGEFVTLEPSDIGRSTDISDNGVNFHKSEAIDKLVNKSEVDYISEKDKSLGKVLLEVTPETVDAVEVKVNELEPMKLRLRPRKSKESEWLISTSVRQPPMVTIAKSVSSKSELVSINLANNSERGGNPTVNHHCLPKECGKKTGGEKDNLRSTSSSSKSKLNKISRRQTELPRNQLRECMNGCQEGSPNDINEEIFGYYEACDHPRCKRPLKYKNVIRCFSCNRCFHHLCVHAKLQEITDPEYTCPDCRNERAIQSA